MSQQHQTQNNDLRITNGQQRTDKNQPPPHRPRIHHPLTPLSNPPTNHTHAATSRARHPPTPTITRVGTSPHPLSQSSPAHLFTRAIDHPTSQLTAHPTDLTSEPSTIQTDDHPHKQSPQQQTNQPLNQLLTNLRQPSNHPGNHLATVPATHHSTAFPTTHAAIYAPNHLPTARVGFHLTSTRAFRNLVVHQYMHF